VSWPSRTELHDDDFGKAVADALNLFTRTTWCGLLVTQDRDFGVMKWVPERA
jgi:hypothetical protein